MLAVGPSEARPVSAALPRAPRGSRVAWNPPHPARLTLSSGVLSSLPPLQFPGVPLSGKYSLPSAKGKPWKMLLYAWSGQRNYIRRANV